MNTARAPRLRTAWPLAVFVGLALTYCGWARLVVIKLWSFSPIVVYGFPMRLGYEAYSRWDAAWYVRIATSGYYYDGPGVQSAVAFFPVYPAAIRLLGVLVPDLVQAGIVVTLLGGAVFVFAIHRWTSDLLSPRIAMATVALVLVWPYAYYLFGVVYSDALFLGLAVGSFVLLERRHPWLAAVIGAAATATRPVGVAVAVALVLRSLELDRVLVTRWSRFGPEDDRPRLLALDRRRLRISTLAPAASVMGIGVYCAYLWYHFGDPLAFTKVGGAAGWSRDLQLGTVLKSGYIDVLGKGELTVDLLTLTVSALATAAAFALSLRVLRRLGFAYAVYCVIVVGLPFLTSPEFRGMGRYVIAAFPCFAVVAEAVLATPTRRRLLVPIVAVGFLTLGLFATYFIRGYYMA